MAVVAAEDTRVTRKLWSRYEIDDAARELPRPQRRPARPRKLLERLEAGDDVALVTDAGTPLVSDPGEVLVARLGRSAAARSCPSPAPRPCWPRWWPAGIPAPRWGFEGFLPRKGRERQERLARIAADDRATVLFEAHGRTAAHPARPGCRLRRRATGRGRVAS